MEKSLLLGHEPGCDALSPCRVCGIANFIREKLSEDDFKVLAAMVQEVADPEPPYGKDNPVPLEASVNTLHLTARSRHCLKTADIRTIGELVRRTEQELLKIPNLGKRCLEEIRDKLEEAGRQLGTD